MAIFSSISNKILVNGSLVLIGLILIAIMALNNDADSDKTTNLTSEKKAEIKAFQADADIMRLRHLKYWVATIEDYYDKHGKYPLQGKSDDSIYVVIATPQQHTLLSQLPEADVLLPSTPVVTYSMAQFVDALETGLNKNIEEYYDPQQEVDPQNNRPNFYSYTINGDRYGFIIRTNKNFLFGRFTQTGYSEVEVSNVANPSANLVLTPQTLFNSSHYKMAVSQPLTNPEPFEKRDTELLHISTSAKDTEPAS